MKRKLESRLLEKYQYLRYADDTTLMAERVEKLKSLLTKVKEESEKGGLKLNIQKPKIMESNPITSWQIEGEKVEILTDFLFLFSKITVNSDCNHEIKRHLLFGRKITDNRLTPGQCIKNQRHRFADKGLYSQSFVSRAFRGGVALGRE